MRHHGRNYDLHTGSQYETPESSLAVLVVKNLFANTGDIRDAASTPGSGRFPWRREWLPTLLFLPGESHGQRMGYSPWGWKESDTTEREIPEFRVSQSHLMNTGQGSHDPVGQGIQPQRTCQRLEQLPEMLCICLNSRDGLGKMPE